jgi:hypothetical protein
VQPFDSDIAVLTVDKFYALIGISVFNGNRPVQAEHPVGDLRMIMPCRCLAAFERHDAHTNVLRFNENFRFYHRRLLQEKSEEVGL